MTITARLARRQLSAARTLFDRIHDELPLAIDIIHVRVDRGGSPDDDRPRADDAGIRSIGGHTDPTGDAAISRVTAHEHWLADIEDQLRTLALTLRLLVEPCSREVASAAGSEPHPRCSGGSTVEEWTRPDCTAFVDYSVRTDGSYSYRQDGLCTSCRVAKHRWQAKADEVA
jgi:hypothetical protein